MNTQHMEERLWEYIDGRSSVEETAAIEKLLQSDSVWKQKYNELVEIHQLVQSSTLEEPSMRFTKNVMEEIAKYHIAPATKTYINKKIILGIGIFFVSIILGFLVYGFAQSQPSNGKVDLPVDLGKVDYGRIFSNTYINIFMLVNVILALMLFDRFLANKKKQLHKNA